ncbi:MAG: pilus assembly protein [Clostridia bacterium]|nr:pilus assembly protein [Clostridia bacterium]
MNTIKKIIRNSLKKDSGMLVVEATMVFPVMFLVIFLMIFMGNAYFQKSRIDSIVTQMAYYGSAQCADPLLREITEKGKVPSLADADYSIEPYRYLLGEVGKESGMNAIETQVENQISNKIKGIKTGLFSYMKPSASKLDAEFNNAFVYSTFNVEVQYKVPLPIRLIGMKDYFSLKTSSKCEVPVSDTPEFIRNVDMVEDWVESTETGQNAIEKAGKIMDKVSEFIN